MINPIPNSAHNQVSLLLGMLNTANPVSLEIYQSRKNPFSLQLDDMEVEI